MADSAKQAAEFVRPLDHEQPSGTSIARKGGFIMTLVECWYIAGCVRVLRHAIEGRRAESASRVIGSRAPKRYIASRASRARVARTKTDERSQPIKCFPQVARVAFTVDSRGRRLAIAMSRSPAPQVGSRYTWRSLGLTPRARAARSASGALVKNTPFALRDDGLALRRSSRLAAPFNDDRHHGPHCGDGRV